ncbi:MAG TPA: tetratricopeptide repeat protein [Acidobacteriota bacterium]|nr:tetratricopeptide repeat protein [Acidobacteriota bacterium]
MRFLVLIFAFVLAFTSAYSQQEEPRKGRKPILIRDDPNEKKSEDQEMIIEPNPRIAAEHLNVGDFYFRRDNYKAAEDRYREAVKYNPKSVEAWEKLARSLEKQKALADAIAVYEEFLSLNPRSKEVGRFRERVAQLRAKLEK